MYIKHGADFGKNNLLLHLNNINYLNMQEKKFHSGVQMVEVVEEYINENHNP